MFYFSYLLPCSLLCLVFRERLRRFLGRPAGRNSNRPIATVKINPFTISFDTDAIRYLHAVFSHLPFTCGETLLIPPNSNHE